MWEARSEVIPSGRRYRVLQRRSGLTFHALFDLLENNTDFTNWYANMLADTEFEAFFWEHPPLTTESCTKEAEFVLIESSSLAKLRPEPEPFRSQFALFPDDDVIAFPNLGGDAVLIAPRQMGSIFAYGHFAAFVRNAPEAQVHLLLNVAAQTVREKLSSAPTWLSTAGLGVTWLHLRLDTRPKYYQFSPYKAVD